MGFCPSCALRLKAAVSKHEDLSLIDTDVITRRRRHRGNVSRQLCYAALTHGYLEVAVSVDPETAVTKRPGTRLLFILDGHGPRVQRDAHHALRDSSARDVGNNFFRMTAQTIEWISDAQETVLDLRKTDRQDQVPAA